MDNSKHHLKQIHCLLSSYLSVLIDNISDLLLHHVFLIAKRYIYTCKLDNCNPVLQVYIQTVMNSMEIEKAPRTNKLAVIK